MGAAGVGWQTVWLGPIGQGYCANCLARNVSTPSDSNNWRSEAWWSCIFVANVCRTPLDPCPSSVCRACGNVFRVRDAQVVAKAHDYICPVCKGNVASNVKTGKIDHRTVCGSQFSVKDGVVKEKGFVYQCPHCKGNVESDVRTARINHQRVCGNRFYVKDSILSKDTRCHAHTCPVCATVVWSSHSSGRIACRHDTPLGQRCRTNQWYVPDRRPRRKRNGNKGASKRTPAQGGWVPKRNLERLEGLKPGKTAAFAPIKSCGCGLGALACKVRGAKGTFGGFEGWQTAALNANKKLY